MSALTVTIDVAGSRVGGQILTFKLARACEKLLVWIDDGAGSLEPVIVPLHQLRTKAKRGAQHGRKSR